MNSPEKITEQDLHAFVDGELDVASRAEIEAWLTDHPEDAQKNSRMARAKNPAPSIVRRCAGRTHSAKNGTGAVKARTFGKPSQLVA